MAAIRCSGPTRRATAAGSAEKRSAACTSPTASRPLGLSGIERCPNSRFLLIGRCRGIWRWHIDIERVADLSSGDRLAAVGLEAPRPIQRQWPAFQVIGERLWSDGFRGVLAPSAARPARCVLCLFRETDDIAVATPLRPPITYRHVPVPPTGRTT